MLTLGNHLGENHMLVSGGLLQQPYNVWYPAHHAKWCWSALDRWSKPDRKGSDFTATEHEFLKKAHKIRTGRSVDDE